jgi:glycosyltransferase involved in cell wall biosynthesis
MKILVVTTSFPTANEKIQLGGSFVLTECLAYEKAGAEVIVVTPGVPDIPSQEVFGRNIIVYRFSYFFPKRYQKIKIPGRALYHSAGVLFYIQIPFFLLLFSLTTLLKGRKVDIVHCNWTLSALIALPLRWLYKIPVVLTSRGSDIRSLPVSLNRFIMQRVDGVLDCFGPYPEMLEIKQRFPAKYITLPVIVKEPVAGGAGVASSGPADAFTLVYVGRFDPTKQKLGFGFFTLLEAIGLLPHELSLRCIYVGDGSLKEELVVRSKELGIEEKVIFTGYREDVYSYLECADLVVGGVALNGVSEEASLLGKPQLMPNIKMWQKNLWNDKENCLLYERDNSASMAEAIHYAMSRPEKLKDIVNHVHQLTDKYLAVGKKGGEAYLRVFDRLIEAR